MLPIKDLLSLNHLSETAFFKLQFSEAPQENHSPVLLLHSKSLRNNKNLMPKHYHLVLVCCHLY